MLHRARLEGRSWGRTAPKATKTAAATTAGKVPTAGTHTQREEAVPVPSSDTDDAMGDDSPQAKPKGRFNRTTTKHHVETADTTTIEETKDRTDPGATITEMTRDTMKQLENEDETPKAQMDGVPQRAAKETGMM